MEIASLRAFLAVAEQQSFSRAAESLYLSQPAVSKRIALLEEQLQVALFDRIGRRVSLTPAGQTLLPRARGLLNDAREIERALADLSGEIRGRLLMATSHHIGLHRLPGPLKAFTRDHPGVELEIRFMDSEAACHAVEIGDLELAIVTLPTKPLPHLQTGLIWDDPLVVMVGRDHPLSKRKQVELETLLSYPAVLPSSNTYTRAIMEQAVQQAGLSLQVSMETNYLETLGMLTEIGLGWSLLPATQLTGQLVTLAVPGLELARQLGSVIHEKRSLSSAARAMIASCQKAAGL